MIINYHQINMKKVIKKNVFQVKLNELKNRLFWGIVMLVIFIFPLIIILHDMSKDDNLGKIIFIYILISVIIAIIFIIAITRKPDNERKSAIAGSVAFGIAIILKNIIRDLLPKTFHNHLIYTIGLTFIFTYVLVMIKLGLEFVQLFKTRKSDN